MNLLSRESIAWAYAILGIVSLSTVLSGTGNYLNFYEAVDALEMHTVSLTQEEDLGSQVILRLELRFVNPTEYEGLKIFHVAPSLLSLNTTDEPLVLNVVGTTTTGTYGPTILYSQSEAMFSSRFYLNDEKATSYREFVQKHSTDYTPKLRVFVILTTIWDKLCRFNISWEGAEKTFVCGRTVLGGSGVDFG